MRQPLVTTRPKISTMRMNEPKSSKQDVIRERLKREIKEREKKISDRVDNLRRREENIRVREDRIRVREEKIRLREENIRE